MSVARRPPPVPEKFALLYEFANSLDLRRFAEGDAPHRAAFLISGQAGQDLLESCRRSL
jgi:hypothetical protein